MPFELPESYRAYCSDVAVRTAVDHILLSSDKRSGLALPADIDWEDLPAFHRAVLSAHQVRCEYAVHLIRLWNAVWQPALECRFGKDRQTWTVADSENRNESRLDTNTVWNDGWFGRGFDIDGTNFQIVPGVWEDHEQVRLSVSFWEVDGRDPDHTSRRNFGDDWPVQQIEDGCAWTKKGLAPIRDDGTIDLDPLHKAADDALSAISRHLGD